MQITAKQLEVAIQCLGLPASMCFKDSMCVKEVKFEMCFVISLSKEIIDYLPEMKERYQAFLDMQRFMQTGEGGL